MSDDLHALLARASSEIEVASPARYSTLYCEAGSRPATSTVGQMRSMASRLRSPRKACPADHRCGVSRW